MRGAGGASGAFMSKSSIFLGAAFLACAASVLAQPAQEALEPALVVVQPSDPAMLRRVADELEAQGARLPHRFADGTLLGLVPPQMVARIPEIDGAQIDIEPAGMRTLRGTLPPSARAARRVLAGMPQVERLTPYRPLEGDQVEPLAGEEPVFEKSLPSGCDRPTASSAFMAGSIAIGILVPESTGAENTEDWTNEDPAHPGADRIDLIVAEITQGCDDLVATLPEANLSFWYDVRRAVPIDYEPILHSVPDRAGWIDATLDGIGHGVGSSSAGSYGFITEMRDRFDTDWGAVAYVADDWNDVDNGFNPSGFPFAYALLGGPYLVMTYGNDGWGIDNMDVVFRHELGHVFHALDEYTSAGNDCAMTSGYLAVKNGNNASSGPDAACESSDPCVMRANSTPACPFSRGQMGIRDSDADGILDVRDVPPDSGFDMAGPLLIETDAITLDARSSGLGLSSENPDAPASFSINRVVSAEAGIDGAPYAPLTALDGSFGGRCEDLQISLSSLSEGWHDVLLRATNDVGILEPSPASLRIYVNTDCADDAGEPADDARDGAVARPVGTYALRHCAYDSDWSRFYLTSGAALSVTVTQSITTGSLEVRLIDEASREIARASAVGGVATFTTAAPRSGTYFLVVEDDAEFETDYQLDILADCIDDPEEPDAPAPLGLEIRNGTLSQRVLCAADEDRYYLSVQAGETIDASLAFDGALGDLDLELLDPSGAVIASSTTTTSAEAVSFTPTVEGPHVVRVFGKTSTDRNLYDLTTLATGCLDDPGENDDDVATARALVAGLPIRGTTCGADSDWFTFTTAGQRLVRVHLAYDAAAGNDDLELRDASGVLVLRRSTSPGSLESITAERLLAGTYAVRVVGTSAASVRYTLTLEDEDPILLFVRKDGSDAVLTWNLASQECFTLRRHSHPTRRALVASDFDTPRVTEINEGDPSVPDTDWSLEDLETRDRDVIDDGMFLYTYLVDPHDCGASLVASTKVATPSPVLVAAPGGISTIDYVVTIANTGVDDAFGVRLLDDLPRETASYTILALPVGATDNSQPAPAGANLTGLIDVSGMSVPAGTSVEVRFQIVVAPRNLIEDPMVDNQARLEANASPVDPPLRFSTDDPATTSFPDDTRVFAAFYMQQMLISAFWHSWVDVDIQVQDPCGNLLGPADMASAMCGGGTSFVRARDSCAMRSFPGRYEQVGIGGFPPPPGEYVIRLSYRGYSPDDPDCTGRGPEEVTIVVQHTTFTVQWRTITLQPGDVNVEAFRFTL